jgi:hypothetical protein
MVIKINQYFCLEHREEEFRIYFDMMWIEERRIFFRFTNDTKTPFSKFKLSSGEYYYINAKYRNEFRKEEKDDVYSIPLDCFTELHDGFFFKDFLKLYAASLCFP